MIIQVMSKHKFPLRDVILDLYCNQLVFIFLPSLWFVINWHVVFIKEAVAFV